MFLFILIILNLSLYDLYYFILFHHFSFNDLKFLILIYQFNVNNFLILFIFIIIAYYLNLLFFNSKFKFSINVPFNIKKKIIKLCVFF